MTAPIQSDTPAGKLARLRGYRLNAMNQPNVYPEGTETLSLDALLSELAHQREYQRAFRKGAQKHLDTPPGMGIMDLRGRVHRDDVTTLLQQANRKVEAIREEMARRGRLQATELQEGP